MKVKLFFKHKSIAYCTDCLREQYNEKGEKLYSQAVSRSGKKDTLAVI